MNGDCLFRKEERISSRKLIDALFSGGGSHSKSAFPLRVVYMLQERLCGQAPAQVLVSVPKRRFRHAVDRNRVKRQIREAYRLNKHPLVEAVPAGKAVFMAFIWLSDEHLPSAAIEERVRTLLTHITRQISL